MVWVILHVVGLLLIVYAAISSHVYTRRMQKQVTRLHAEFISSQDPQAASGYRKKLMSLGFEAQAWSLADAPADAEKALQKDPLRRARFGWAIAGIGLVMVILSQLRPS